jgi:MoaA/NifB/PqqE/SkfB family radical SAM enzyme
VTYIAPQAKLFAHIDRLAVLKTGHNPPPINVEIDLSNRCSLGCSWCHFGFTHTRGPLAGKRDKPDGAVAGGDLMDTDLSLQILDQLRAYGVNSVTWTGGGEPTLHPDFDRIVHHAALHRMGQGTYTHGGHIDEKRARWMKRTHTFVYVSLDAIDAASYKKRKGVDRFEAACDGIRRLVAADGDATIGVGFLLGPDTWHDVYSMGQLVEELGADYAQARPTIMYSQEHPGELAENAEWVDDAITAVKFAMARHDNIEADVSRFEMYRDWQGHGYARCWWSALQTCITPNGKVWTCVNLREHPAAEIGDLSVESFAAIWGRHTPANVDHDCRIMCRGHIANQALDVIMAPQVHADFV